MVFLYRVTRFRNEKPHPARICIERLTPQHVPGDNPHRGCVSVQTNLRFGGVTSELSRSPPPRQRPTEADNSRLAWRSLRAALQNLKVASMGCRGLVAADTYCVAG